MDDDYLELVLDVVAAIPPGRVMTYGTVAEVAHDVLGRGGPRQVGRVLAHAGSDVPWWRVVNAAGQPPAAYRRDAVARLRDEGCPLSDDGAADAAEPRVRLRAALWWPPEPWELPAEPERPEG